MNHYTRQVYAMIQPGGLPCPPIDRAIDDLHPYGACGGPRRCGTCWHQTVGKEQDAWRKEQMKRLSPLMDAAKKLDAADLYMRYASDHDRGVFLQTCGEVLRWFVVKDDIRAIPDGDLVKIAQVCIPR